MKKPISHYGGVEGASDFCKPVFDCEVPISRQKETQFNVNLQCNHVTLHMAKPNTILIVYIYV